MKKRNAIYLWFVSILFFGVITPLSVKAVEKKAQVGFRFLENPVSAAALGRGDMGILGLSSAEGVYSNPSSIAWMSGRADVTLSQTLWIADIKYNAISGALKAPYNFMFGVDYMAMNYGDFYGTRRADNDQGFIETDVFSPSAWVAGITMSQRVSDRFSYGVRIKYAYHDYGAAHIATEGSTLTDSSLVIVEKKYTLGAPAIDIGTTYAFGFYGIRFGAVIQNFSQELQIEREKFPMPYRVGFSADMDLMTLIAHEKVDMHTLRLGIETIYPRDFRERLKVGMEYALQDIFFVRTGYLINYDERGFTAGIGIHTSLGKTRFIFDYGFQEFGNFEGVHVFSAGFGF